MARSADPGEEARFAEFIEALASVIGHADRVPPLTDYCTGLLLPCARKSVEPLAAVTAPERVAAQHQSLLHFVANAPWSDERLLAKVREFVLPSIERHGPIRAWIIDDTSFPKQGRHSVGVARQYCGQLGKRANCQVAVSLSLANNFASLPVAWRLYLPQAWIGDAERRAKTGIPEEVGFATKLEIALSQVQAALAAGLPRAPVLMDAGYGHDGKLRAALTALDLGYVAAIRSDSTVWPEGTGPLPPMAWSGRGRKPVRLRRDEEHQPPQVKKLAFDLPAEAWETITWREGTAEALSSRFARLRVRPAHRDNERKEPRAEEWLLIEWPEGEAEPSKYWLSTMPPDMPFAELVDLAKLRWRIERDYRELKQELGLGHYEGRGWRGFHHHASLCIAAYAFLIAERAAFPPSAGRAARKLAKPALPKRYRPRGAPTASGTPRP